MTKLKSAAVAVAKSAAVQKEAVILIRLAAAVLAAKYGLSLKF